MKYLVLGSSGQVGGALKEYLEGSGHEVLPFDIVNTPDEDLRIYDNQLLNARMREADFVFFLAFDVGGARYLKKYQHTYDFLSNNVKIMNFTFEILREYDKKFIFASSQMSNMAYSPYGVLKALGEYYTRVLGGLVIKFWNVYGVERDLDKAHVITDFVLKAKNERIINMLTDGTEERQFLYSDDACESLQILSEKYEEIRRDKELHITSGKWDSILRVAKVIASHFDDVKVAPAEAKDEVQKFKRNEADPYILKYWKPKTSLEEGIAKIVEFYKGNQEYGLRRV